MSPLQFLTLRRFQNWGCALLLATFWAPTHTLGPAYLDTLYSSRTTYRETGGARWLIAHFDKSMKGKSPWFFLQTLIEAQVQCLFYQWTFVVVQSLSRVQLLVTPWTAARQASLSFTTSWSLRKLMFIESMIPSNHLILCLPLLLLPSVFPSIRIMAGL